MKWGDTRIGTPGGTVTWSFAEGPGAFYSFDASITLAEYQDAVRAAFDAWSRVADIEFVELADSAASDIRLGWDTLDGPGNVRGETAVGQRTGPGFIDMSAEISFDIAETWYPEKASDAQLLYRVALHEIGHAIGLAHTDDPTSIMHPVVLVSDLSATDITDVQAIYGEAPGFEPFATADLELVATTYQFFTGSVPTEVGFEYLIDSRANSTDLNDAYYAQFNQENRFINFSNNLGSIGAGAAQYETQYGSLTFNDAVAKAYDEIVGFDAALAANIDVDAALAFIRGAVDFYTAVARERVVPSGVPLDDALKIVMIGSVMHEAIKADIGHYATAVDEFVSLYRADGAVPYGMDLFAL